VTRDALTGLRPDLVGAYDAALPGARAEILARLLGALQREPLRAVTGRRQADGRLYVTLAGGRTVSAPSAAAVPFAEPAAGLSVLVDGVALTDPVALLADLGLPGHTARFGAELGNSVANLALARTATARPGGDGEDVTEGHPLHPCCRTRAGMSTADVLAYAPEHHPVIRLRRLRVPAARWSGDTAPVLLAHPWQAARILDAYPWLVDGGPTGPVRPLMSLRTVAPLDGGDHVKTAVDVQMTSAVRTVSPAAVHNGPHLSALLAGLTADLPLDVLREHSAGAVIVDGAPHRGLAHLRRQAPDPAAVPAGALTGDRLARTVAAHGGDPHAWFAALTRVLLPPLLAVLHRGVALEAHGQNTLIVLHGHRPVRVQYRDFGGVRVSAARLAAAGVSAPPLHGDLPCDDPAVLRTKLAAAVLGTVVAQQVALLARHHGGDPDRLWAITAGVLRDCATGTHLGDVRSLLTDPLPVKATTVMRLADDPLDDVWAPLGNPMAGHA
jgi:siderophore synthetase component